MDPETGAIYHLKYKPPPPEAVPRLVQRSDDTEEKVRAPARMQLRLRAWAGAVRVRLRLRLLSLIAPRLRAAACACCVPVPVQPAVQDAARDAL